MRNLFSQSAGLDALYHLARMHSVAKMSGDDSAGALVKARELGGRFLFEGQTNREWQWFLPALDHGGSAEVVFEAEDFGFSARDWPGLRDRPDFWHMLAKPVTTRRAVGSTRSFLGPPSRTA